MAQAKKAKAKKVTKKKVQPKTAKTSVKTKMTKKPVKKKTSDKVSSKKKPTAKKSSSAKKSVKKKRTLVKAPEEKRFWTREGHIIADLLELQKTLENMSDELFAYHAHGGTNHFAMWVELVLDDPVCASDIKKARTRLGTAKKVHTTVKKYL